MSELPAGNKPQRPFFQRLSPGWVLTFVALLIWFWIRNDYGITLDEPEQCAYGEAVRNYLFGSHNVVDLNRPDLPSNAAFYGPLLGLVCATIAHAFNSDIFAVRHAVQGLLWVAMFYPVCALGRRLSGRLGAWCAGFALLGLPSLIGHAFNNPKDLPLACAVVWLLYVSVLVATARRLNWVHALKLGIAVGFVLAMRPGAWFLCGLLALAPFAAGWHHYRSRAAQGWLRPVARTFPVVITAFVIGWILMVLPWPQAWHSPFGFPVKAAVYAMHFDGRLAVLVAGTFYPSDHLPWNYLLTYFALTIPLPLLLLALWGQRLFFSKKFWNTSKVAVVAGAMFLFWVPMAMFIAMRPNIYDGMRHFLFILVPFALAAGTAAASLIQALHRVPRQLTVTLVLLLLISSVPAMIRLHPYENVFYNSLAGPRATLPMRYETDYWFSSYREAALWLNQAGSNKPPVSVAVATMDNSVVPLLSHFLNSHVTAVLSPLGDFREASLPTNIDYYVATTRFGQSENYATNPVVHTVDRDGIVLTVIRENRR